MIYPICKKKRQEDAHVKQCQAMFGVTKIEENKQQLLLRQATVNVYR